MVPAGHAEHCFDPVAEENVPARQLMHWVPPVVFL
jgi:hypothetical protein